VARQWPGISSFSRRTTRARLAGRRGGLASLGSTRLLTTDSAVGGIVLPVVLPAGGGAVDRVARIGSGVRTLSHPVVTGVRTLPTQRSPTHLSHGPGSEHVRAGGHDPSPRAARTGNMSAQASTFRRHAPCRSTAQHVARHQVPQTTRATPQGVVTPRTSTRCSDAASSTRPADAPAAHSQANTIRFESHVPCGSRARVRGLVRGPEQARREGPPRKGAPDPCSADGSTVATCQRHE
jgi:hypothetical protein